MDKLRCDNVRRQQYPERGITKKSKYLNLNQMDKYSSLMELFPAKTAIQNEEYHFTVQCFQ